MEETKTMWLKPSKSAFTTKIKIKLALWLLVQSTLFRFSPHKLNKFRIWLLNVFGADIQDTCFVHSKAMIYMPWNLIMGNRSSIDFDVLIYSLDQVIIGDFVSISYKVNLNTGSHDHSDPHFKLITQPVIIESGSFIGTESYIAPGVTIGQMTVIGARSVVTKNMPSDMICFGHPCKSYKKREKKHEV